MASTSAELFEAIEADDADRVRAMLAQDPSLAAVRDEPGRVGADARALPVRQGRDRGGGRGGPVPRRVRGGVVRRPGPAHRAADVGFGGGHDVLGRRVHRAPLRGLLRPTRRDAVPAGPGRRRRRARPWMDDRDAPALRRVVTPTRGRRDAAGCRRRRRGAAGPGWTALRSAARNGDLASVEALLAAAPIPRSRTTTARACATWPSKGATRTSSPRSTGRSPAGSPES